MTHGDPRRTTTSPQGHSPQDHASQAEADARTVADCIVVFHDGGASSHQLATALGWDTPRLYAALEWLVAREFVGVGGDADAEWPFPYLRQNARTAELLSGD